MNIYPDLFDRPANRLKFHTDTLFTQLRGDNPRYLVRMAAYWSSLWSHTRQGQWKGYLEIDQSDGEDGEARNVLNRAENEEAVQ